ncbi:Apoptotic ATPase [Handroanthus impetiginosus]|uniref:Apoptotic ATPase n=1 Tax=Handroanthus impetiginosus TaxID=429701 RepID=A0A2G9HAC8_9LAMI|nr:Apoptotic ATPase [Handroanthus impetiginosus]
MAYFAAVISLKNTIQRLLNSSQLSILPPSEEILQFALKEVRSVQEVLQNNEELIIKNCDNGRVTSLTGQIREAAYKLEDALESHASDQYESLAKEVFLDFDQVKEEINYFVETMKKIEKTMMEELSEPLPEAEEECVAPIKFECGKKSKMVGLSKEFDKLKDLLINEWAFMRGFLSITGMAGIGPKYQSKKVKVMLSILEQMHQDIDKIRMEEDADLTQYILRSLQGKKYLIVFDDVWNELDLLDLISLLPKDRNPSLVLVTSRLEEVNKWHNDWNCKKNARDFHYVRRMRLLNKEESWDLLREKVFGEGYLCPFRLEKVGKKIAQHCEGLPLTIITVANILSKREKTLEYWEEVANENTSVFPDAYDQMLDVLILSYNHLPQYLKSCFLHMGAAPPGWMMVVSKQVKYWHSEGFIEGFEDDPRIYFEKLNSTNIILVHERSSRYGIKSCKLHSAFWHLCVKQASKEKFLHVINDYASCFTEDIENQRRLCIHNNVLLGIKEVRGSMESISMERSLLCTGRHHRYPVPICFGLRLLRVLNALTIRFYNFPTEVLKLVWLRHLAFTYNGNIPGSISELRNLEHLIVNRHLIISKFSGDSSYLPLEIWNMEELRHIQLIGGNLPHPCGALLPNLLTLSGLSVNSCSKEILERTPNLIKLGIQITLSPDVVEPLCRFDYFSHLHHLESLKCVILNPKPKSQVVATIRSFTSQLKKLNLSGLGYPWKYMRIIALLPNLEVLKLRRYAFQGPVWETYKGEFSQLKYLLLKDMDLVHWRANSKHCFPSLERLIIKSCYLLREIPSSLRCNSKRGFMKLVDCPSSRASVRKLREDYKFRNIFVESSLDDEKLK